MLTPSNTLGRRCGAPRRRHAVADAAVFVAAILAALVAVAARARALSPGSHARALSPGSHPTLSPKGLRQAWSLRRPTVNEVPAEYHLMAVSAAALTCPKVVDISYSAEPSIDQPLPWRATTNMAMSSTKKACLTRVWYIAPSSEQGIPYKLNGKPQLSTHISKSASFEVVLQILTLEAHSFLPLVGWTDGKSEHLSTECREWLMPPWTFWAFFIAGSDPIPLRFVKDYYGTVPAGARGALLSTRDGKFCGYVEAGATSLTPPPVSRGDAEHQRTQPPKEGSLSSATWRVATGIGIGSSLVAALAVAAGVAVLRRRLVAVAKERDTSDGDGMDRSGCAHCVGGYGADVGVSCLVHAAGEVVTDAAGGGADHGAAGVVEYERALDSSMVGSFGDDLTVDGLFCTFPPRVAPDARRPNDTTQSIGSSEWGAPVSSLSDHMDVDGLVREVLQLPPPPPPPPP